MSIPRGSIYGLFQTELENVLTRIINQITLPDSGEIILMVKTATQTRSIHLFTRRKRIVQHHERENNCIWPK
jgi:ABC-type methionine transport system ATPase subunit